MERQVKDWLVVLIQSCVMLVCIGTGYIAGLSENHVLDKEYTLTQCVPPATLVRAVVRSMPPGTTCVVDMVAEPKIASSQ